MSRNLGVGRLPGLMLLAAVGAWPVAMFAQDAGSLDRGIAPATDQRNGGDQAPRRIDRSQLTQPDLRANAADPSTGKPIDPRIETLLEQWSKRTKEIKSLQGRHLRSTRDFTFNSETVAEGRFYVETPDKGRIDVGPYSKTLPPKPIRRPAPNGGFVQMKLQPATKRERWICDGTEIKAIDDDNKTYDAVKIPPSQRGENIMDGPLPFLFGMPPEKAKARYEFKYLGDDAKSYAIEVRPKLRQDAIDWMKAQLLLDRELYLPVQVHLYNAAGTTETVYYFKDLQINKFQFPWTNPFHPVLTWYKRSVHNSPVAGGPPGSSGVGMPQGQTITANRMPSVIGADWKVIEPKLKSLGLTVKPRRGDTATAPEQVYHVEYQDPPPYSPLDKNATIYLTLYVPAPQHTVEKPGP